MKRLTEYYDGEARAIRIDHKKAFAKLAAYEDTELTPEEVATLKQELITTRSRLVDLEKALNLACAEIASFTDTCPLDLATKEFAKEIVQICLGNDCDNDIEKCWQEYLLKGARGKHE